MSTTNYPNRPSTPSTRLGRCLAIACSLAAALAGTLATGVLASGAAHAAEVAVVHRDRPPDPPAEESTPVVDGFALTRLPAELGPRVSEQAYTWEEVDMRTKVWESRRPEGGYRVDLNTHVLRGRELRTGGQLREFLTRYLERDSDTWELDQVTVSGRPGLVGDADIFWLVRPGVAVWISVRADGFDRADLTSTARGVRERA